LQKWYLEQGKEVKFSPVPTVTDSLCYGGGGVGGGGPLLCLWAEISTGPSMVNSNVIEKIKLLAFNLVNSKGKGGANSHLRSLSQLLFAMEERALKAAAHGCVCGPRYQLAR
jgi:hypothetical protein